MDQGTSSLAEQSMRESSSHVLNRWWSFRPIGLRDALQRDANNFDLIRLFAALMVLFGHAYSVTPQPGKIDPLLSTTGFATAGVAVKIFFFLSGLLVTNSLLEKRSVVQFAAARFFRIWPALFFVLAGSAFVIGPLYTQLDIGTYLADPNSWLYLKRQLMMQSWGTQGAGYYNLPGVFEQNPYARIVNASLWSLVVEVVAYIMLAACFMVGLTSRWAASLLIVVVVLDAVLPFRLLFWFLPKGNEDFSNLPFCFAVGFAAAVFKNQVKISPSLPAGLALLYWIFHGAEHARVLFYLLVFAIVLWAATWPVLLKFRPRADLSYGAFLWGFPIQQSLAVHFAALGVHLNQLMATVLTLLMAYISWTFIEKRSIDFGHRLGRRLANQDLKELSGKSGVANK